MIACAQAFDPLRDLLIQQLLGMKTACSGPWLDFSVDGLPPSVNRIHVNGRRFAKGQPAGPPVGVANVRLSQASLDFRQAFWRQTAGLSWTPQPNRILAAALGFYSPTWVAADGRRRRRDVDNRVKALLDAIDIRFGIPDESYWQLLCFKLPWTHDRTRVQIFELCGGP